MKNTSRKRTAKVKQELTIEDVFVNKQDLETYQRIISNIPDEIVENMQTKYIKGMEKYGPFDPSIETADLLLEEMKSELYDVLNYFTQFVSVTKAENCCVNEVLEAVRNLFSVLDDIKECADPKSEDYYEGHEKGFKEGYEAAYEEFRQQQILEVDPESDYNEGFEEGYAVGQSEGYKTGYDDGYEVGHNE